MNMKQIDTIPQDWNDVEPKDYFAGKDMYEAYVKTQSTINFCEDDGWIMLPDQDKRAWIELAKGYVTKSSDLKCLTIENGRIFAGYTYMANSQVATFVDVHAKHSARILVFDGDDGLDRIIDDLKRHGHEVKIKTVKEI